MITIGSFGVMGYDNYNGFEANSNELRYSILSSYDDGKTGFIVGTNFWRAPSYEFKEKTPREKMKHDRGSRL